jgi:uncharacterized Ntn-hydrolase superfamily protein
MSKFPARRGSGRGGQRTPFSFPVPPQTPRPKQRRCCSASRLHQQCDKQNRRQLSIVDARGTIAAFTGSQVQPWRGHREGSGYVVAGNLLVSDETILAMAETFEAARGSLGERLVVALEAGQAAGGDRRGKVSAALRVVRDQEYPYLDLRVDEHPEPVAELRRIFDIYTALSYLDDLHPTRTWRKQKQDPEFDRTEAA